MSGTIPKTYFGYKPPPNKQTIESKKQTKEQEEPVMDMESMLMVATWGRWCGGMAEEVRGLTSTHG